MGGLNQPPLKTAGLHSVSSAPASFLLLSLVLLCVFTSSLARSVVSRVSRAHGTGCWAAVLSRTQSPWSQGHLGLCASASGLSSGEDVLPRPGRSLGSCTCSACPGPDVTSAPEPSLSSARLRPSLAPLHSRCRRCMRLRRRLTLAAPKGMSVWAPPSSGPQRSGHRDQSYGRRFSHRLGAAGLGFEEDSGALPVLCTFILLL